MNERTYYNENDAKAAAWLKELIGAGVIPRGDIDQRSIAEVRPSDLDGYTACHFFAGIGGWALALRLAGWPDDREVWTGSCPCQPFSCAGHGKGEADERHLWPVFGALIDKCKPPTVFGEQVASKLGREWLSRVRTDLEAMAYAVGTSDLCAAGIGSPHIRQRLYWMAYASNRGRSEHGPQSRGREGAEQGDSAECAGPADGLEYTASNRWARRRPEAGPKPDGSAPREAQQRSSDAGWLADSNGSNAGDSDEQRSGRHLQQPEDKAACGMGDTARAQGPRFGQLSEQLHGPAAWSDFDIIPCADGKARRVESGTFPLAHGISGRVGLLRGYGNAIVPTLAADFIKATQEAINQIEGGSE